MDDNAENALLIDKMMLVISHIASFREEITGYFILNLPSPYYLRIHLACPLLWLRRCKSRNETKIKTKHAGLSSANSAEAIYFTSL